MALSRPRRPLWQGAFWGRMQLGKHLEVAPTGSKILDMDLQCSIPAVPIPILYLSGGIRPDKDTRYAIVASESLDDDSVKRWAHRKWLWDSIGVMGRSGTAPYAGSTLPVPEV